MDLNNSMLSFEKESRLYGSFCICSLEKGGTPPKFVIIDDGWQSVEMDSDGSEYKADNSAK